MTSSEPSTSVVDPVETERSSTDQADDQISLDAEPVEPLPDPGADERHDDLIKAMQHLQSTVDALGKRSNADQDVISRMQARLEVLQVDQVRSLLGPVITELAGLHADFAQAAEQDYETLGITRVKKQFGFLGDRIENAIDLLGAVSIDAKPGQKFDSRLHAAVKQLPTGDPALDKTIASVSRQGFAFRHQSKPALYASVSVYRYDNSLEASVPEPEPMPAATPAPAKDSPKPAVSTDTARPNTEDRSFHIPFESDKE